MSEPYDISTPADSSRPELGRCRAQIEVCRAEIASLRRAEKELLRMAQEHRNRAAGLHAALDAIVSIYRECERTGKSVTVPGKVWDDAKAALDRRGEDA